jgi:hypothetical protein
MQQVCRNGLCMRDGRVRVWEYTELFPIFFDRVSALRTERSLYA